MLPIPNNVSSKLSGSKRISDDAHSALYRGPGSCEADKRSQSALPLPRGRMVRLATDSSGGSLMEIKPRFMTVSLSIEMNGKTLQMVSLQTLRLFVKRPLVPYSFL